MAKAPTEQKTLTQQIADESVKAPVAVIEPENDTEMDVVKANHPNASRIYRDERGHIVVKS